MFCRVAELLTCCTWPKVLQVYTAQAKHSETESDYEPGADVRAANNKNFMSVLESIITLKDWEKDSTPLWHSAAAFLEACAVCEFSSV